MARIVSSEGENHDQGASTQPLAITLLFDVNHPSILDMHKINAAADSLPVHRRWEIFQELFLETQKAIKVSHYTLEKARANIRELNAMSCYSRTRQQIKDIYFGEHPDVKTRIFVREMIDYVRYT